ncbi:MAG TPA: hypothetical protein VGF77_18020 [Allosphingosinicella sp.]|jgi:hypothetical protein
MTRPAAARIDEARVAAMRIGECAPQPVLIGRNDDHMHVVRHQAVAPNFGVGLVRRLGEQIAIEPIIAVLEEGLLPAIPALRHMIGVTRQDETGKARHASDIAHFVYLVSRLWRKPPDFSRDGASAVGSADSLYPREK